MNRRMAALLATTGLATLAFASITYADNEDKVTFCHASGRDGTTKFETLTISRNALSAHFDENGTPQAGHEDDYLGECVEDTTTTSTEASTTSTSTTSTTTSTSTSTTSSSTTVPETSSSTSTTSTTQASSTTSEPPATTTPGSTPPTTTESPSTTTAPPPPTTMAPGPMPSTTTSTLLTSTSSGPSMTPPGSSSPAAPTGTLPATGVDPWTLLGIASSLGLIGFALVNRAQPGEE